MWGGWRQGEGNGAESAAGDQQVGEDARLGVE